MSATKPPPGEWADRAACKGMSPEWFLPEDRMPIPEVAREACARCLCRRECLDYALMSPWEQRGLWGGTGPRERKLILKARRRGAA